MTSEKVAVIVPVYNAEQYVDGCVHSILNQNYRNIEVILVDDGSTDGSVDRCMKLCKEDNRVKLICAEHVGPQAARMKGVEEATTEIITFSDADDYMESDLIECLMKGKKYDLVCSGITVCNLDGSQWIMDSHIDHKEYVSKEDMNKLLSNMICVGDTSDRGIVIHMAGKLYHKNLIKQIANKIDLTIRYGEDRDFLYHYMLFCSSAVIYDFSKYRYLLHSSSSSKRYDPDFFIDANRLRNSVLKAFEGLLDKSIADKLRSDFEQQMRDVYFFGMENKLGYDRGFYTRYIYPYVKKEKKNIAVFGAGAVGSSYVSYIEKLPEHKVVAWADSNYYDSEVMGHTIIKPEQLKTQSFDEIWIAIKDDSARDTVKQNLIRYGIPQEKIISIRPIQLYR